MDYYLTIYFFIRVFIDPVLGINLDTKMSRQAHWKGCGLDMVSVGKRGVTD